MPIIQRDSLEEITHWEPFCGIETLQREMNRLFDRLMPSDHGEIRTLPFVPSAELEETKVMAEPPKSVKVTVH